MQSPIKMDWYPTEYMSPKVHKDERVIDRVRRERDELDERNKELTDQLKASQLKTVEWPARYEDLEFHLRRVLADNRNSYNTIQQLEKLVKQTEVAKNKASLSEAWKTEDIILQKDQEIVSVISRNMALEEGNRELTAKVLALENEIFQSKTAWQSKVDRLEGRLRRKRAEMEASLKIIKELEKQVKDTLEMEVSPGKKRKSMEE